MTYRSRRRSGLPWGRVVDSIRMDRAVLPPVREEAIRASGLRASGLSLSAWRGRSGQRYVVRVHPIAQAALLDEPGAVILGVRRDGDGRALIVGAGHAGSVAEAVALCAPDGASEIHLHCLADSDAEREAIIEDLVGDDAA